MNYDLAKELKDAGFPMKDHRLFDMEPCHLCGASREQLDNLPCPPTLSELIEACNDHATHSFAELVQMSDMKTWRAFVWEHETFGEGSTPEDAVARLWLALNKK